MDQPLDQVSGSIFIRGRAYSAKEIIRGLLEQGIAINEKSEGLRIGFKLISPESYSARSTMGANSALGCPFVPYMNQITEKQFEKIIGQVAKPMKQDSKKEESQNDDDYNDKQTRSRKTEDT